MDLNGLASLSWREAIIIISIVLGIYIVFTLLRLQGLKRQDPSKNAEEAPLPSVTATSTTTLPVEASAAVLAYENAQEDASVVKEADSRGPKKKANSWYEPPTDQKDHNEPRVDVLERDLVLLKKDRKRLLALEQELTQFRKEVGGLRAEIMVLKESIAKAPRIISPQYNDAMEMAVQGLDADAISQHCGISRAEADLVAALARHQN